MSWTSVDILSASAPLPEGYRYQLITRNDIPDTINAFASWYPGIAVGNASCHLKPAFYEESVVLDGESERDFLVILFKHGQELAGILSVERDKDSAVLYGRVGVISPQHRGLNLSERFPSLIEALGRKMGMGMVYGLATPGAIHGREVRTPGLGVGGHRAGLRPGDGGAGRRQARVRRHLHEGVGR